MPAQRLAISLFVLAVAASPVCAQGMFAQGMPKVGDTPERPDPSADGSVVIHWFCTPKLSACVDDLARIVRFREAGDVYVVWHLNAPLREAKEMIPPAAGVATGRIDAGPDVQQLFKRLRIANGPASVVVDLDGTIKAVTSSADVKELDSRDAIIRNLVANAKPYTITKLGPTSGKAGAKLAFTVQVQLGRWTRGFNVAGITFFKFQPARGMTCDEMELNRDQLKFADKTLTATVTCTAPKGSYEASGKIHFEYRPWDATGAFADDRVDWTFGVN